MSGFRKQYAVIDLTNQSKKRFDSLEEAKVEATTILCKTTQKGPRDCWVVEIKQILRVGVPIVVEIPIEEAFPSIKKKSYSEEHLFDDQNLNCEDDEEETEF